MIKVGIICEYNPFHNGHKKQIDYIRRHFGGEDVCIVCVMSGNLTQRGEVAITDKYTRAEMALACGADAVLELPFPYCSASADYFAFAGVNILDRIGADYICFGSESADTDILEKCARMLTSEEFECAVSKIELENAELGSAAVTFKALEELLGESVPSAPNDILAISYLKHLHILRSSVKPLIIKREGDYNSPLLSSVENPSASAIRAATDKIGADSVSEFMPPEAFGILKSAMDAGEVTSGDKLGEIFFHYFRFARTDAISKCAEISGGLENRILSAAREAASAEEFIGKLPTKKYTDARIRRAMLFSLTDVRERDLKTPPAYTTLLAANKTGRELLALLRKDSKLPILSKPADFDSLGEAAVREAELMLAADATFTLCKKKTADAGCYFRKSPKIL